MGNQLKLVEFRATLFTAYIPYTFDFYTKVHELIPGCVPVLNSNAPEPMNMMGSLYPPSTWTINAPSRREIIIFQPNKIDYLRLTDEDENPTEDQWNDFIGSVKPLFEMILEFSGQTVSRMAIAPKIEFKDTIKKWDEFIKDKFSHPEFEGHTLIEAEFTQTFRTPRKILDSEYQINFVCKFMGSQEIKMTNGVPKTRDLQLIELDINTAPLPDYDFSKEAVSDFFNQAETLTNDILKFYFPT